MKIALISAYPVYPFRDQLGVPDAPPSHPYPWVKNLATHLARIKGNDVHLITMRRDILRDTTFISDNVTYHYLLPPPQILHYITLFQASVAKIKRALDVIKPDIVHGQGTDRFGYYTVNSGYPNVLSLHGIMRDFQKKVNVQFSKRDIALNLYVERTCFKKAKYLISVSQYCDAFVESYKSKALNYHIENAVNEEYFKQPGLEETNDLLYVGSITPRKRFMDILRVLTLIPDTITLRVVSFVTSPASYDMELKQFILEHKLSARVNFVGNKDAKGIAHELAQAKIFVLSSGAETAPLTISEAMSVGKPVVASNAGGIPWMVSHGETGFIFDIGDIGTFASYITTLVDNPDLRKSMGVNARRIARERFHPELVAFKTFETYKEILVAEGQKKKSS